MANSRGMVRLVRQVHHSPFLSMNEKQITRAVIEHWRSAGKPQTLVASIPNAGAMGQYGLTPGLPDLLVIGPDIRTAFIELKTNKGKVSDAQRAFGELCMGNGILYAITYGRDEPIELLRAWRIVK